MHPLLQQQQYLEHRLHQTLAELQTLTQYQIHQEHFEKKALEMEGQTNTLEQALPVSWEINKVIAHLLKVVEMSQLHLIRQVIAPEVNFEHYVELVIHLELEGYYMELLVLIYQLEKLPFMVNIRNLEVRNKSLLSSKPRLQIQMDLSVFRRQSI
ncbi:MAG: type 4a pilus biogenesis protein PilO [SAR324 cluster bacterium]|nr:type 4a pilus biogenesis protein PilO [SAR324 cluster bacterium]